jgi:hypothetical protein
MGYYDALRYRWTSLPVGWERVQYKSLKGNDQPAYYNQSFPRQFFHYPFPLPNDSEQADIVPPARFLFCRTRRNFMRGAFWNQYTYTQSSCVSVELSSTFDTGTFGFLTLNTSTLPEEFGPLDNHLARQFGRYQGELKVDTNSHGLELVELSHTVSKADRFFNDKLHPRNEDGLFELCNVMWIEWEDGTAYRRAVGQIMKPTWESFDLEWIDLTLG